VSSEPKNILYLSSFGNLRWGGQKSLFHLVTRLNKQRYRPYVFLPTDEDFAEALRKQDIGVIIYQLPPIEAFNLFPSLLAVRFLIKLIYDYKISLIHTDGPRNTFYAGLAARWKHLPVVFHVRDANRDRYDKILYRLSQRLILVARILRSRFDWEVHDDKFVTIYNGVELNSNPFQSSISQIIKKEFEISDEQLTIVSTGRIEAEKGQKCLVEACGRLKDRIKFRLLLIGEVVNEEYAKVCENVALEFGIQDCVAFTGYREDIDKILQAADIFVLPSTGEAFSRAIVEAMAAGKPVVATDVGGTKEAIENGISGFLVPPEEPMALADKILALATNETLRKKFGAAARKRVEDHFTIERNIQKTEQVYQELLGEYIS
jgi:glycosyltransferase involved in cell wall biosynthesis